MVGVREGAGSLPIEVTSFVGRSREQTEAKKLLSISRLLTLTGIGGVGKTRLALKIAENTRREFEDSVWLVELGELRDPSMLGESIAGTLHLVNRSNRPIDQVLVEHLGSRQLLLVLDNCEHVLIAVAELAARLLRTCPDLRILATSREQLNIDGESVMRVSPMEAPDPLRLPAAGRRECDAVTLFAARAVTRVPEFKLTEENRVTVAQICYRLDGLPLSVELAAARLASMSATQILRHLDDRYSLLSSGRRDAPNRQQTLRFSIDWSHDLCTPSERTLWARLSVFAGSFELDAIQGICGDEWNTDLISIVSSLVDKSILIREEPGVVVRYKMLETLREYGLEQLSASGEDTVLRRRHSAWFARLASSAADGWVSSRHSEWMARLGLEQKNIREALEFCFTEPGEADAGVVFARTLYPFWLTRGLFGEGRRWLDRALDSPSAAGPDRAQALLIDSVLSGLQGDRTHANDLIDEATSIIGDLGDSEMRALLDYALGYSSLYQGDSTCAASYFTRSLEKTRILGNVFMEIGAVHGLGLANLLLGRFERSIECFNRALQLALPAGASALQSHPLWALGISLWRQGESVEAERSLEMGLRLAREVDDSLATAFCLQALAWIAAGDKQERRASTLIGAVKSLWRDMGGSTITFTEMQQFHDDCERRARDALGQKTFEDTRRRGEAMRSSAAIAYALRESGVVKRRNEVLAMAELTKREREVASLVAEGFTNKEIAKKLFISLRTAQGHVENILVKLDFKSRAQIAAWFVERR